jgi:hypothetical protein
VDLLLKNQESFAKDLRENTKDLRENTKVTNAVNDAVANHFKIDRRTDELYQLLQDEKKKSVSTSYVTPYEKILLSVNR